MTMTKTLAAIWCQFKECCAAIVESNRISGDFGTSVAKGNVDGEYVFTKFGRSAVLSSGPAPLADVWTADSVYTGQPVSMASDFIEVSSTDANDTTSGTGARTVSIKGLKTSTSTVEEEETITLAGTSSVSSVNQWWRVNRMKVLTAGSSGANQGVIQARHSTSGDIFAIIEEGINQSQIAAWTVPANKEAILKRVRISIARSNGSATSAFVTIRQRDVGGVYRAIRTLELTFSAPVQYTAFGGDVLPSGTDIKVTVESVSDPGTTVEAALEFLVYEV